MINTRFHQFPTTFGITRHQSSDNTLKLNIVTQREALDCIYFRLLLHRCIRNLRRKRKGTFPILKFMVPNPHWCLIIDAYRSSLDIRRNFYKIVVHIQYVNSIRLIRRFYRLKPTEAHSVVYVERGVKNCYLNWYCIGFTPTRDVGAPSCCGFSRMKRTMKMNSESGLAELKLETTLIVSLLYLLDEQSRSSWSHEDLIWR